MQFNVKARKNQQSQIFLENNLMLEKMTLPFKWQLSSQFCLKKNHTSGLKLIFVGFLTDI